MSERVPTERVHTEVCAWPGCVAAVSWRNAFCYQHWKFVPADERRESVADGWHERAVDRRSRHGHSRRRRSE